MSAPETHRQAERRTEARVNERIDEQIVRIGEARFATHGLLRATLGSCVGIGLIWRARGRCALAHCLLPSAQMAGATSLFAADRDPRTCARYVDRALPVLLRLLEAERGAYAELEAVLVGGASLAKLGRGAAGQIGLHNIEAARACLAQAGLRVALEQVGGAKGWQVSIDATQLSWSAREIAAPAARTNVTHHEVSHGHARTR
ncbi:MAG TPA: chemotaxis protein CheD [Pararobbsia sp.]|nr:chemotaxis protein CheD [Pararobbsia sp.]